MKGVNNINFKGIIKLIISMNKNMLPFIIEHKLYQFKNNTSKHVFSTSNSTFAFSVLLSFHLSSCILTLGHYQVTLI